MSRCRRVLAHPWLFFIALRAAHRAQRIRQDALPEVIEHLLRTPGLPRDLEPALAACLTRLATRLLAPLGYLGTCMVRASLFATLVGDQDEVVLHIGFFPEEGRDRIAGHAWVSIGRRVIFDAPQDSVVGGLAMSEAICIPIER